MSTRGRPPVNVKTCQVEGCLNLAEYALYKTFPDGAKTWLNVCRLHEKEIGDENVRRAKGSVEH